MLFIRTDRLGETLLNIPAVQSLKQVCPAARLTWMVNPQLVELLEGLPGADAVVPETVDDKVFWRAAWDLSRQWRRELIDAVIVSNAKKVYHLAAYLGGIPVRIGYDRKWGFLLTHRLLDQKMMGSRHEVECNLDLLRPLGFSAVQAPLLSLPVRQQAHAAVLERLKAKGIDPSKTLVAIHPWTSNVRKQWAAEHFQALIKRLASSGTLAVAIIGGTEHAVASSAFKLAENVHDFVGSFSLPELAAFLQLTRVLVSNDSGPVHVAAAVGTSVVALFGTQEPATGPARWGPWGDKHAVIWKQSMDAITVDEVFEVAAKYLR